LAGFASYGHFRDWPAYKYTVEHSVYVRADVRAMPASGSIRSWGSFMPEPCAKSATNSVNGLIFLLCPDIAYARLSYGWLVDETMPSRLQQATCKALRQRQPSPHDDKLLLYTPKWDRSRVTTPSQWGYRFTDSPTIVLIESPSALITYRTMQFRFNNSALSHGTFGY
jgi:hypothetical protein